MLLVLGVCGWFMGPIALGEDSGVSQLDDDMVIDAAPLAAQDSAVDDSMQNDTQISADNAKDILPSRQQEVVREASAKSSSSHEAALAELPPGAFISKGERVALDDKGFSLAAPQGWIIRKDLPRSSLFIQAPVAQSQYPRNITVLRFKEPKLINRASAEDFAKYLVASYPQASNSIENYSLRSHERITLNDGREGWLFYTELTDTGLALMQAHILVSSQSHHYLVTFTDKSEHFEGEQSSQQPFMEAWSAMTSLELESSSPSPVGQARLMAMILVAVGALLVVSAMVRRVLAKRRYRYQADDDLAEDEGASVQHDDVDDILEESKVPASMSLTSDEAMDIHFAKTVEISKIKDHEQDSFTSFVSETSRRVISLKPKRKSAGHKLDESDLSSETPRSKFRRGA